MSRSKSEMQCDAYEPTEEEDVISVTSAICPRCRSERACRRCRTPGGWRAGKVAAPRWSEIHLRSGETGQLEKTPRRRRRQPNVSRSLRLAANERVDRLMVQFNSFAARPRACAANRTADVEQR